MLLALFACLLGGSSVPINESLHDGPASWFRLFSSGYVAHYTDFFTNRSAMASLSKAECVRSGGFRCWLFLSTHLPTQITSFLILLPGIQLTKYFAIPSLQATIASLHFCSIFLAILVADLAEYWIHRAFHKIPFFWRFHSHSNPSFIKGTGLAGRFALLI